MKRYALFLAVLLAVSLVFAGLEAPSAVAQVKPIKIGFGMSLSGPLGVGGKQVLIAMQVWRDDVNAKGGLLGRPVELVYYDDHTKPADVPPIYTKLITVDKVDFVVSGYGTVLIAAAMPIVMEHKMVFMSFFGLAVNPAFNYKYYFQAMPAGPDPYTDWSEGFFNLASKQTPRPQTVALVGADHEYGVNAVESARKNAVKYGFKVVYDKRYPPPPATTDFTPTARAIKAVNPDIVFVGSYPPDSVGMVKAAKEVGLKPKIFGGAMVGPQYAPILQDLGPMLNGVLNFWFWVPEPTLKFPGIEEFLKRYQERAKKERVDPLGYHLPPLTYAGVQILGQAIDATRSLDQTTVGDYIRTHEFDTIVGKVKFGPNGEWERSRVLQAQFRNIKSRDLEEFTKPGKMVVVYPEEYKSGELIYPFPGWE